MKRLLAGLLLALLPALATAATATHRVSTCSTTDGATYTSGSFTPSADELLVAFAVCSDTVQNPAVMTSSTTAMTFTQIVTALYATSANIVYAFVSDNFARNASQTVTLDVTGDNATGCCVEVFSVSGMNRAGLGAIRQNSRQQNQAAAGTPAPAFSSSALTGNVTAGVVGNATNAATLTPPTSWTEQQDTGYATPTTGAEYVTRNSGFTGTTITWGSTSATVFGDIIVELDTTTPAYNKWWGKDW